MSGCSHTCTHVCPTLPAKNYPTQPDRKPRLSLNYIWWVSRRWNFYFVICWPFLLHAAVLQKSAHRQSTLQDCQRGRRAIFHAFVGLTMKEHPCHMFTTTQGPWICHPARVDRMNYLTNTNAWQSHQPSKHTAGQPTRCLSELCTES